MRNVVLILIFGSIVKADLFQEYFDWKLRNFPTWAIKQGYHQYNNLMEDYSPEAIQQRHRDIQDFAEKSKNIKNYPGMLMHKECQIFLDGFDYSHYFFPPVNFLEGAHARLPLYFKTPNYLLWNTTTDYENNLEKLQKIPTYFNQMIELLKEGNSQNLSYPDQALNRTCQQFNHIIDQDPSDSDFFTFFKDLPPTFEAEWRYGIECAAYRTIRDEIIPAYVRLRDYLMDEYVRREQPGMSSLPNGQDRYTKSLAWHTTLHDVTPMDVHQSGLNEVARLRKEFSEIISKTFNSTLSVKEFFAEVKSDPEYEFESQEEVLETYREMIHETIWEALHKVFDDQVLSDPKIQMVEVKAAPTSAGANVYYSSSSADGTRNGTVYINLSNLKNIKKYDVVTLALHEGNPGHHFQEAFLKSHRLPKFMQNAFYRGALSEAPSRLPVFTAYLEGWALYAEYLGDEMGLYHQDHSQLIGFYSFNLLRAARCVVDTGIHSLNWTMEEARDYLMENTALSEDYINAELDRYVTWPGQSTAYKIGELAIKEIRKRAEEDFKVDTKTFHHHVLSCLGPLDGLQECVEAKINGTYIPVPTTPQTGGGGSLAFSCSLPVVLILLLIGREF